MNERAEKNQTNRKGEKQRETVNSGLIILPLILLAVLLAIGSAIWNDYRDQIMENHKNQLLLTTRVMADNMTVSLKEYQSNLEFLGSVAEETGMLDVFEHFLAEEERLERDIFWEDEAGTITRSLRNSRLCNPILISQGEQGTSLWQYGDASGRNYLVFKTPLNSGERLCLAVDEERYYQQLISEIQIGTNGYVVVKNSSGLIVMHPEKNQWGIHVIEGRKRLYPGLDFTSLEQMVEEQCQGGEGISEYYSYWWSNPQLPRVKKISAYAPAMVGEDFLVVSSVVDYDDFSLPIEKGFRDVSLLYMGAIAGFLVMFLFVGKLLIDRRQAAVEINTLQRLNQKLEELHRGEEMLAHQQRLQVMGIMTGGIAHEFNNFLTPIMGHAELLMMELPEGSEEYDSALEIYEASEKAKDVIRQISSLSRKNVETVYKSIPIGKLLSRAVKMMDSICPSNVRLQTDISLGTGVCQDAGTQQNPVQPAAVSMTGEPCILGNSTQLNQVLLNICINAVHAIGKNEGIVQVRGRLLEKTALRQIPELNSRRISDDWSYYLHIQIEDNGCGMSADTLRQIFNPFFTTKKAGEGTGLGLALAEQIVLSHRGYIYAESQMGKGTVFHVLLPVMEGGKEPVLFAKNQNQNLGIVIADDNAKVLQLLQKSFDKLNLPVAVCRKKEELQELLAKEQPDVLIINEILENGSGIEFCMASQGRYPGMLKLIMVDCLTETIVEAKQKGIIDGYLTKPVSDTAILEAIRAALTH